MHHLVPASKKSKALKKIFRIENEYDWLYSRGGRTMYEVFSDEKGRFVYMTTFDGTGKVYIPRKFE